MQPMPRLPRPETLADCPRESWEGYVSPSDADRAEMLRALDLASLDDLFAHLGEARRDGPLALPEALDYAATAARLRELAAKNHPRPHFLGDGLPSFSVDPVVPAVSALRGLTTAYTPYQPERSQGTLVAHWIYQSALSALTGFEAINSSLYDRATAIYEAAAACLRLRKDRSRLVLAGSLLPADRAVVETLAADAHLALSWAPLDPATGTTDLAALEELVSADVAGVVFPQVNALGLLEDADRWTDVGHRAGAVVVAVVDPLLLAAGGLKRPVAFGGRGADIVVGEGQHLAIGPNFGGPGLGIFGVRHAPDRQGDIRQAPGRFVGRARDHEGRLGYTMVLSTREQHIRREKATSNICSNQAFVATLAGAAILSRGDAGLSRLATGAHARALEAAQRVHAETGARLAFPKSAFYNEIVLELPEPPQAAIEAARKADLHLGVDVSDRIAGHRFLIKLSFSDTSAPLDALVEFLRGRGYPVPASAPEVPRPRADQLNQEPPRIPSYGAETVGAFYAKLADLNVGPDAAPYPLGSCTMKYNPALNDWAAGLRGFTDIHPQAPLEDAQGCLEVLWEIQEWFKAITGLVGVTTQPVAGAQGELVGLKMFQAYHRDRGESHRDIVLIPNSAHGTNFATATMAGYQTASEPPTGIVGLRTGADGRVDVSDFRDKVAQYGARLAGVMITNPNTTGLFETGFAEMARLVHEVGGLVYMDGANMNAIAGWVDLGKLGVDAVHQNLHKTWSIPHGGGGPGDAIVAVSARLVDYLPGVQIERQGSRFIAKTPTKSIGSFHRHFGNFAHKVRAYTYLLRLGRDGVGRLIGHAVLNANYLARRLRGHFPLLPAGTETAPRLHEFIVTLAPEEFAAAERAGITKQQAIVAWGKLFLDFGYHAPTVAWPEALGLMIEPTESYTKAELDRLADAILAMRHLIREHPEVLKLVPLFTPLGRVDEATANRAPILSQSLETLPELPPAGVPQSELLALSVEAIRQRLLDAARQRLAPSSS